jgi:hypothetical protein
MTCECVNIQHDRRCTKVATKKCTTCRAKLCGGCGKNHHAHTTIVKLEDS